MPSPDPLAGEGADLPLPAAALRKMGPSPTLGRTVELTLLTVVWGNCKNVSMGYLALPPICNMVAWVNRRCSPSTPLYA